MTAISVQYDAFQNGLPRGISNVVRDGSNRLTNWIENGYAMTITRDASGHPLTLTARGQSQSLSQSFLFDPTSGLTLSTGGAQIPTSLIAELFGAGVSTGTGTVKTINAVNPDGSGNVVLGANDVSAISNFVPWSLDTNVATPLAPAATFTPANGTFPPGGFITLEATSSGAGTQTLDGFAYVAGDIGIFSPALGVWVHISGSVAGAVNRVSNYTPVAAWTGSTSESPVQMSLTLASGTLVSGQAWRVKLYSVFSATNDTVALKHYLNGVSLASGTTFTAVAFLNGGYDEIEFIVIDATHVAYRIGFDTSATTRQFTWGIATVTTGAGLAIGWTYTLSATSKTATATFADARSSKP